MANLARDTKHKNLTKNLQIKSYLDFEEAPNKSGSLVAI